MNIEPGMIVRFVWHEEEVPDRLTRKKETYGGVLYFSPSVDTLNQSEYDVVKSDGHLMIVLSVQRIKKPKCTEKYAIGVLVEDRVLYTRVDPDCWYDMVSDPFRLEEVKL